MKLEFKKVYTVSNFISFFRILLAVPIFFYIRDIEEIEGARYILLGLFILVYITDLADGYVARKLDQVSELGKIIDPFADKMLVILVISYLYYFDIIPGYYFWIVVLRDLIIFTGGIIVSRKIGKVLPSNYLGKIAVSSIGVFIIVAVLGTDPESFLYSVFLYLSIILSFASVMSYGIRGIKEFKKGENEAI